MRNITLSIGVLAVAIVLLFIGFRAFDDKGHKLEALDFMATYQDTPGAILIDVRSPQEFAQGHLESALNIDIKSSTFNAEIEKLDKRRAYFVYCRSGNRSAQAVAVMQENGFEQVYDLKGGITSHNGELMLVTDTNVSTSTNE